MMLSAREVHVWIAFDQEFPKDSLLGDLGELLDPREREMAARKRAPDLPRQLVVTRALQRLVLSRYAPGVAATDWKFLAAEHGKPAPSAEFAHHGLHFNIAHTSRLVAMAVGRHALLGVDVEALGRRAPIAVAPRHFTAAEAQALAALPAHEQPQRFFSLWTLKESWLKATGEGLAGGLDNVSFEFADASQARSFWLQDGDEASWRFWQAWPSAEHVLALAVRAADPVDRVRIFRWVPARQLSGDELAAPRPVR
jgi:4'-phosphopantetheinyl transferase